MIEKVVLFPNGHLGVIAEMMWVVEDGTVKIGFVDDEVRAYALWYSEDANPALVGQGAVDGCKMLGEL